MTLPSLENWASTRDALHQIAQVAGAVCATSSDPSPNDLHFSLELTAGGLSTARMRCGGVLSIDFAQFELAFLRNDKRVFTLDISGHSQTSLMRRLLSLFGDCDYAVQPSLKHITHDTPLACERTIAIEYQALLDAVYTALARFRARLSGHMTPLALWPHHFDLAFIWFPTPQTDEQTAPQIAFGFAPYSPGLERPYFYAYAWSKPTGYVQAPVEAPAQSISAAYTGLYAAYDDLRERDDFCRTVESMLLAYQRSATPLLV